MSGVTWVAIISALAAVLIAVTPWLTSWLRRRRVKSAAAGTVATSQAGELWTTSMALIDRLQADNEKLVTQRDRLVDLMDHKIAPALDGIAATQRHDGETLYLILSLLEGGAGESHTAPARKD